MTRYYDENLKYPDMTLYQEIIWLQSFFKGKWVIENVKPYYKPLIQPTFTMDRHCYWASDFVMGQENSDTNFRSVHSDTQKMQELYGINLDKYAGTTNIRKCLRNAVKPEDGLYIFEQITKGVK